MFERLKNIFKKNVKNNVVTENVSVVDVEKINTETPQTVDTTFDIFSKLYNYQLDVVKSTLTDNKGIVCMPTGTGKTFCQAAMIAQDIISYRNNFRMYIVNAPRIILTYQLFTEVCTFLIKAGIEARYMFVHSGGTIDETDMLKVLSDIKDNPSDIPYSYISSGTSTTAIREMVDVAKKQELPLIFFSTYNSCVRIEEAIKNKYQPISLTLNDEAHYLVREDFHDILHTITTDRCYFFTATMKVTPSDKGRGMNNSDVYGNVLYQMVPREAIDMGKMVRPRLHIVNTDGVYDLSDYNTSLSYIIKNSFKQHEEVLENLKPKLLVSVKGTEEIRTFINSKEYTEMINENINIFVVSSTQEIGNQVNGETCNRQTFLKKLKICGLDDDKKMLVLHYDILSEGIDVSGFTGIMPLRTLEKSKFLQTFGRAARLDKTDRYNITNNIINPSELDKMVKPYAYIIIPNLYQGNSDDKENFRNLVIEMREYGFEPLENILSDTQIYGLGEDENIDGLNEIQRKNRKDVGELIEKLKKEIEDENDAKLSDLDFFGKELSLLKNSD